MEGATVSESMRNRVPTPDRARASAQWDPDAAQAEYGYDGGGQPRKALVSQKLGCPYKGFIHND